MIISLHRQRLDAAAIAAKIPCSTHTVYRWINRQKETNDLNFTRTGGRKRKTTEEDDSKIVATAKATPLITPGEIKRNNGLQVSKKTIRRRLNQKGLYGRVAEKEHIGVLANLNARISFASGYENWTMQQWKCVVFSDETLISLGINGQVWVQRPRGAAHDTQYLAPKISHAPMLCVWGCISYEGVGVIDIFEENLDAKRLKNIIRTRLIPYALQQFQFTTWWYLHDNDPKHSSREVQQFLFSQGIQCLDFPPYSPDINPIENLWSDLKRRMEKRNSKDIGELRGNIELEWFATDINFIHTIVESMPRRCKAIIESGGHITKY